MNQKKQTTDLEVVLNGGEDTMDSGTIPIQWFLSRELIAQMPQYLVIAEQSESEFDDNGMGRRYLCEVKDVVKFIQFFRSGLHRLAVIAFAGKSALEFAQSFLKKEFQHHYNRQLDFNEIIAGTYVAAKHSDAVVAATCCMLTVPKELFAQKPTENDGWRYKVWQFVEKWHDVPAHDQCKHRKRIPFSLIVKPILLLIWLTVKHLVIGVVYALYVLVASFFMWFCGYQPKPILPEMKKAFFVKDRHNQWVDYSSEWFEVVVHSGYKIKKVDGQCHDIKYAPWEITMFISEISASIIILLFILINYPVAIIGLATGTIVVYVYIVYKGGSMFFRKWHQGRETKRSEKDQQKIALAEKKRRRMEDYQRMLDMQYTAWLESSLLMDYKPSAVNLNNLPKTFTKADEVVKKLRVSFWSLKAKVCRPYEM